jgi:hypothetical protein
MPTFYPTSTQTLPLTTVQRRLLLPVPGEVLAQMGEKISEGDIIAKCQLPGKIWAADVSQALGIPRERAGQSVRQSVGDRVRTDDVLAQRQSRFGRPNRCCQAAVDGRVVAIHHGVVLVEAEATALELRSPFAGRITDIVPEQGVVLSAMGALLQGLWGCGGETTGIVRALVDGPHEPLTAKSFETGDVENGYSNAGCCQSLAVGGAILDEATLEKAVEAKIGGLIVGSVEASLLPRLEALPCPVLVTEGFGALAMRSEAFTLLRASEGRRATMATACQPSGPGGPPTVFIPMDPAQDAVLENPAPQPAQVGMRIRGLRAPYQGLVGTIRELPGLPLKVDSGIRLPVAIVELDGGEQVAIPLVNLEALPRTIGKGWGSS